MVMKNCIYKTFLFVPLYTLTIGNEPKVCFELADMAEIHSNNSQHNQMNGVCSYVLLYIRWKS